jgi:hypothetical protein
VKWFRTGTWSRFQGEVSEESAEVRRVFASARKMTKMAALERQPLHFYVDPRLAEKFTINLHLADFADADGDKMVVAADKKAVGDFVEKTVSFPSKRSYESSYLCSVVFQKPDDEVYAVSAYLTETYLGQYAFKTNYYFRKGSRGAALRCYNRVLTIVNDTKESFSEGNLSQNELPYHMRRALQGEVGEVEPKANKMATYLNPDNVAPKTSIGSENILFIPKGRSIVGDLDMAPKKEKP